MLGPSYVYVDIIVIVVVNDVRENYGGCRAFNFFFKSCSPLFLILVFFLQNFFGFLACLVLLEKRGHYYYIGGHVKGRFCTFGNEYSRR